MIQLLGIDRPEEGRRAEDEVGGEFPTLDESAAALASLAARSSSVSAAVNAGVFVSD
jgi:hypothetical protein